MRSGSLHEEFYPSTGRYMDDYVQYVTGDFLAALGFGATQQLGEDAGIFTGWSVSTTEPVFIQPWLAAQGVAGSRQMLSQVLILEVWAVERAWLSIFMLCGVRCMDRVLL